MKALIPFVAALLITGGALAVEPKEMLKDPVLEARAREIGRELACVVCQGETIDESGADIAADMRVLVRQRIAAGESNNQIIAYMVSRYGDYVRLKPRFIPRTYLLWLGPFAILIAGGIAVLRRLRSATPAVTPLTAEEAAVLSELEREQA
jgi:cytochrome c-type biogenesis protein CcmH